MRAASAFHGVPCFVHLRAPGLRCVVPLSGANHVPEPGRDSKEQLLMKVRGVLGAREAGASYAEGPAHPTLGCIRISDDSWRELADWLDVTGNGYLTVL